MMKKLRVLMIIGLVGAFGVTDLAAYPGQASAAEALAGVNAVNCPVVRLDNWRNSPRNEKLAFLFGFATLLELEKEWQHNKPLPIKQSVVGSWVRGLDGVTLGQMCDALDKYVAQHPEQLERSVLEALGSIYVRPKMTQSEISAAAKRAEEIRASHP